jgi:hypothetical protein
LSIFDRGDASPFARRSIRHSEDIVTGNVVYRCALAVASAAACGSAAAHGPQIQLTAEGGQIVTRRMIGDGPYSGLTAATRVFVLPVVENSNVWFVKPPSAGTSGPGIAPGYGFVDVASHPFQPGDYAVSFTTGLLRWDGTDFVDAGPSQLQAYRASSMTTTVDGAASLPLTWTISESAWLSDREETHAGLSYRFLADGSSMTSELTPGVYVASLQLSHGSLSPSAPFYFVLPTGITADVAGEATFALAAREGIAASEIQAVAAIPEPSGSVLAAIALGLGVVGVKGGTRAPRGE